MNEEIILSDGTHIFETSVEADSQVDEIEASITIGYSQNALEVPFAEYTLTETFLLIDTVILAVTFILTIFKRGKI